jgi:hypothetical protein
LSEKVVAPLSQSSLCQGWAKAVLVLCKVV